jgi:hypothetical protein
MMNEIESVSRMSDNTSKLTQLIENISSHTDPMKVLIHVWKLSYLQHTFKILHAWPEVVPR